MDFLSAASYLASSIKFGWDLLDHILKNFLLYWWEFFGWMGHNLINVKLAVQDALQPPLIRDQLQKVNDSPAEKLCQIFLPRCMLWSMSILKKLQEIYLSWVSRSSITSSKWTTRVSPILTWSILLISLFHANCSIQQLTQSVTKSVQRIIMKLAKF